MASCLLLTSTRGACSRSGRRGLEWIPSQSPLIAAERSFVPSRSATTTSPTGNGSWVRSCPSNNSHGALSTFSTSCANENAINWTPAFARRKATADEQDYCYSSVLMGALGVALAASTFYNSLPTSTTHCAADQSPTPLATSGMMAYMDGPLATEQPPPHPSTLLTFEKPVPSHHNQFKKAKRAARENGEPYDVSHGFRGVL